MSKSITETIQFNDLSKEMVEVRFILVPANHPLAKGPALQQRLQVVLVGKLERSDNRQGHDFQGEAASVEMTEAFVNELQAIAAHLIEKAGY